MTSYEHRELPHGGMPVDVWGDSFVVRVKWIVQEQVLPRVNDSRLLGYWTDNEAIWNPRWAAGGDRNISRHALNCAADDLLSASLVVFVPNSTGSRATLMWLEERYNNSIEALNSAWDITARSWDDVQQQCPFPTSSIRTADNLAYVQWYAGQYMALVSNCIREVDSHHMILGSRTNDVGTIGRAVILGIAPYVDVIDVHMYANAPDVSVLDDLHTVTGLPILMSEFGFRAWDSGLPNAKVTGPLSRSQTTKAKAYRDYIRMLVALPYVVGWHMFAWVDEPSGGQLFGANSNWGLMHLSDDPYAVLVQMFQGINANATTWHSNSVS